MSTSEPMLNRPLLEARQLAVSIGGHRVCRDLDWCVHAGESWAVLGRNGAGKSTLLATLAGLRAQDQGQLSITRHHSCIQPKEPRKFCDVGRITLPVMFAHMNFAVPGNRVCSTSRKLRQSPGVRRNKTQSVVFV